MGREITSISMCLSLKPSLAVCAFSPRRVLSGDGCPPWLRGTRVHVGKEAGSSHFVVHQCTAAGHRLRGAVQDSELCCTHCKPAAAFLKCCLSSPHVGYSPCGRIRMLSPYSNSLQHDRTTQAGSQNTRCRTHGRRTQGCSGCRYGARGYSSAAAAKEHLGVS